MGRPLCHRSFPCPCTHSQLISTSHPAPLLQVFAKADALLEKAGSSKQRLLWAKMYLQASSSNSAVLDVVVESWNAWLGGGTGQGGASGSGGAAAPPCTMCPTGLPALAGAGMVGLEFAAAL